MTSSSFNFHRKLLLHKLQKLDRASNLLEKGFTLIELLVVLIIIAILITLGLNAFNGVRDAAQSNAARFHIGQEAKSCTAAIVGEFSWAPQGFPDANNVVNGTIPDGVRVSADAQNFATCAEDDPAVEPRTFNNLANAVFCAEGGTQTVTAWTVEFNPNDGFPLGPPEVSGTGAAAQPLGVDTQFCAALP